MRRVARAAALCVAVALAIARLGAQYYERPLTEQDVRRALPVLQADKAGTERLARQAAEQNALEQVRTNGRQQAVGLIAAGTDVLGWLQTLTANAATPSTAQYQAPCSRALTAADAMPSAVFTFGIPAPSSWLAVWRARDQSIPIGDRSRAAGEPGAQRPGATRPEAVTQQTRAFYSSRGFESRGELAPFEWQFLSPDRLVSATVMGVNVLGRLDPCRDLPSGPMIVLKAEGQAFAKAPALPGPKANRELADALDKAGLGEAEYLNLKLQLLAARADAQDPSRLKAAAASEDQQKALAIRRENAEFYRQHAAVLDPILTALQPS
jgi:hypothetical protein